MNDLHEEDDGGVSDESAEIVSARAMAAPSHSMLTQLPQAAARVGDDEGRKPAETDDDDEAPALAAGRLCNFDPHDPRIVAMLQPGGWLHEAEANLPWLTSSARRERNLDAIADAADALLADRFAARQSRRQSRR